MHRLARPFYFGLLGFALAGTTPSLANEETKPKAHSSDEALFIRRIIEFWKDKETDILKDQIVQFLQKYPSSEFSNSLLVILGDTYWADHEYQDALHAYQQIKSPALEKKIFLNMLDCLYGLGKYSELSQKIAPQLRDPDLEFSQKELLLSYYGDAELHLAKKEKNPDLAKQHYQAAKDAYTQIQKSDDPTSKIALAEILWALGESRKSAALYIELAELLPEQKDEMTFQAANVESSFDPQAALLKYNMLAHGNGVKSAEAALNKSFLLYEIGQHKQLIEDAPKLKQQVRADHLSELDFVLGRAYLAERNYEQAISLLLPILKSDTFPKSKQKPLLISAITAAHHLNDVDQLNALAGQFQREFPNDIAYPRILFLKALTYKNANRIDEAEQQFVTLLEKYPNFEKREHAEFESYVVQFKKRNWKASRDGFVAFVKTYPESQLYTKALHFIPAASLHLLEKAEKDNQNVDAQREQYLSDMQIVLKNPDALNQKQKSKFLLKLAKAQMDLQRYSESLQTLQSVITAYPDDVNLPQFYLLQAVVYHDGLNDTQHFISSSEKAINLNEEYMQLSWLRLNLFNAYLQLAQKDNKDPTLMDKAADHLYAVNELDPEAVDQEKLLWLANFYYNKAKGTEDDYDATALAQSSQRDYAKKAEVIFEKALDISPSQPATQLTQKTLALEPELLKLSNVYAWQGKRDKQTALLFDLVKQQNANPKWQWSLPTRTIYSLANALRKGGELRQAIDLYSITARSTDKRISNASKLHIAALSFDMLDPKKKVLKDCDILTILKDLKDLQLRRSMADEPTHLEAALVYAHIRSSLEPEAKREEHKLFLLTRAKEEFTNQDDLWSKDYHASRQSSPQLDRVYQAYLMLLDAQIARLEAKLASAKGDLYDMQAKNEVASSLYRTLLTSEYSVTEFLTERARQGLEELHSQET